MSNINIVKPTADFEFDKLTLSAPNNLTGQTFFTKLLNNNKELFLLTPPCKMKKSFTTSNNSSYCDLMFSNDDQGIISFMENLENCVQQMIYARREKWFHDTIEMDDIENIFTPPLKSYKSGKYFTLRVFTNSPRNILNNTIKVYDEYDNELTLSEVNDDSTFVCVLHVNGLKFSSKLFQIYFELKQIVLLNESHNPFNKKLIITKSDNLMQTNEINEKNNEDTLNSESNNEEQSKSMYEANLPSDVNDTSDTSDTNDTNDTNDANDANESVTTVENNAQQDISEITIDMPDNEETLLLNNQVDDDIKNQRKQLYYQAKSKALKARLDALKMIAEANNLKNSLLLENELNSESDNNEELSISELNELSDSDSDISLVQESVNTEEVVNDSENINDDNINLEIEELGAIDKMNINENNLENIENFTEKNEDIVDYPNAVPQEENQRITIHY